MRVIFQVAKNELRNLFFSPIAWFVTVVMTAMCAFYYTKIVSLFARYLNLGYRNNSSAQLWSSDSLTALIYLDLTNGFVISIVTHLFLFIPLLTMGIIGREFSSGTIKLLQSSPVKPVSIVLGKFIGMAIYNLLLISVVGIFMIAGFVNIQSLDVPPLLCAALGLYLFLTTLTAIGVFMSSLTTYPIVSAFATLFVLFFLNNIGGFGRDYDFVRDLTHFLSLSGRLEKMVMGLLTTKDVVYYLIFIAMFIGFTVLKLRAVQESTSWYVKVGRYLAIIVGGVCIVYISSQPRVTGYFDTTSTKTNTVHPNTQHLLNRLNEGPLEVTLYTNLFSINASIGFPRERNEYIATLWGFYQRFKKDINFKYEYYYALPQNSENIFSYYPGKSLQEIAGLTAKAKRVDSALFKSPDNVIKQLDLKVEDYQLIMQLKYRGRSTLVRFYSDNRAFPDQQNMNAAFSRLLGDSIPQVYFLTGELERSISKSGVREYGTHVLDKRNRAALINIGYDADTLNLSTQEIPATASLLVIADPKTDLNPIVLNKLKSYIDKGGNMFVTGEPGKQHVLNPLLGQIGVQLSNGQLVQPHKNETPEKITNYYTFEAFDLAAHPSLLKYKHVWEHGIRKDSLNVGFVGAAAISWLSNTGFNVTPLYMTSPDKAWLKAGKLVIDSILPSFSDKEGDIRQVSFATAVSLSRQRNNKEQRIVVAGDADFLSNFRGNVNIIDAFYSWLTNNHFPVYTPYPRAPDSVFMLTSAGAGMQKIFFLWVLPGVVLIIGTIILIRRKRK